MHCADYSDLLAAHIDGSLTAGELESAEAHLATCPRCTQRLAEARAFRSAFRRPARRTPEDVRQRVLAALDAEGEAERPRIGPWPWWLTWRLAVASAALALLALAGMLLTRSAHSPDMLAQVASEFAAQRRHVRLEMLTDQPGVLRHHYQQTGLPLSGETVMDLKPLGFQLVGGSIATLGNTPSAMTLYQGSGGLILCYRFMAGEVRLPDGGEDIDGDIFYTLGGVTICIYRDGDMYCLMATSMSRAELMKVLAGYV